MTHPCHSVNIKFYFYRFRRTIYDLYSVLGQFYPRVSSFLQYLEINTGSFYTHTLEVCKRFVKIASGGLVIDKEIPMCYKNVYTTLEFGLADSQP